MRNTSEESHQGIPCTIMKSLTFFALLLVSHAATANIPGSALIVDGDTIPISGMKIRLNGIDTPERKQTRRKAGVTWKCGYEATETLRGWTYTKEVRCVGDEKDRSGRLIAESIGSINTPSCHKLLSIVERG